MANYPPQNPLFLLLLHKDYDPLKTSDILVVSARGQINAGKFPKGLFQSDADKTFGICMLINPWLVAKDWQNYRPSLHVIPVVRTLLVWNMRQNSWKNLLRLKCWGRLKGPWFSSIYFSVLRVKKSAVRFLCKAEFSKIYSDSVSRWFEAFLIFIHEI